MIFLLKSPVHPLVTGGEMANAVSMPPRWPKWSSVQLLENTLRSLETS